MIGLQLTLPFQCDFTFSVSHTFSGWPQYNNLSLVILASLESSDLIWFRTLLFAFVVAQGVYKIVLQQIQW